MTKTKTIGAMSAAAALLAAMGCATQETPVAECPNYTADASALQGRVMADGSLGFEVLECVSKPVAKQRYDELCVLRIDPKDAPELQSWDRRAITFAPEFVREQADAHDIVLAMVFTRTSMGAQLYADDDLSQSIMYRPYSCKS